MEGSQTQTQQEQQAPGGGNDISTIKRFLSQDPKSTLMNMARVFVAVNGIIFGVTTFFNQAMAYAAFQRLFLGFGIASILRLSQRVGATPTELNMAAIKQYMITTVLEDSAHYVLFAFNFYGYKPTTIVGMVPTLYCTMQAASFLLNMLKDCTSPSWSTMKAQLSKVRENQQKLLRVVATGEIFIMPLVILQLFTGQSGSILTPLVYYQFLMLRYMSRRNPYVRNAFSELRLATVQLVYKPACPGIIRSIVMKVISLIERLSPITYQPAN